MSIESTFNMVLDEDRLDTGIYLFTPGGDTFDDFTIVAYSHNGMYKFVWQLYENPFFQYENYPEGFQFAEVPIEEFKQVVAEFKMQLTELEKIVPIIPHT